MANRLANETSPYLLQHKDNPVDWYPWGEEALAAARERDVPILLSIGYSACHWCHVMERESFEDDATAAYMNEHFVCIKLDREERPDLDAIYMEACQAITGQGGWPLNAFLTPEQVPFFAGTYFPPDEDRGMPSWLQILRSIVEAWEERGDEIRATSEKVAGRLSGAAWIEPSDDPLTAEMLDQAVEGLLRLEDPRNGGFGASPKFPAASAIELLLRRGAVEAAARALSAMANGGIYDQLGGGFARYTVDAGWLIPHFEKMLYDNALLARAYLHGWQATGYPLFRRVCEETLDWALREMRGPEGGFYSALDADSEGEEGKFYVWTVEQVREVLGEDAQAALDYFGVQPGGNWEGKTILTRGAEEPEGFEELRRRLYDARAERVWPGLDDKRLTSWNALMVSALADAGAVLEREDYLDAGRRCAAFLLDELTDEGGRLLRTWKDGEGRLNAYLEDHAYLLDALLSLYEATFEPRWLEAARALADTTVERFGDPEHGGFFETSSDHEKLLTRRKDPEDHPIPSGNAAAAYALLRLGALTGEHEYERQGVGVLRLFAELAPRHPNAFAHLLQALDFHLAAVREVALVGDDVRALERVVRGAFRPHLVLAGTPPQGAGDASAVSLLEGREPLDGRAAAYVCERFACKAPVTEPAELEALLG
ncbi:MAG TPA: thioredoxin domain-containing protein [Thermoleophilaceae bacterium]|nr:thioredoxin domain-containing protein [Thermoleophilaceae bacterium]